MSQLEEKNSDPHTIAIIGGGFSGTTLAAQLLRLDPNLNVVVIERFHLPGRGIAYGTQFGLHLLNVPAKNMSALEDDPNHFLNWARDNYDAGTEPDDFLPRRIYGQYVESILRDATALEEGRLEWRQDEALAIHVVDGKAEIRFRSGPKVVADRVVLAVGNFRPSDPPLPGRDQRNRRYIPFAWSHDALQGVEQEESILLIGSGLTSIDLALALRAREFRGSLHILSRRGVIPEWHHDAQPWPLHWNEQSPRTVRGLVRWVRQQVEAAAKKGIHSSAVIDALRPLTPKIWQALPHAEKKRFLRHVRPYWEVQRHRVSPKIGGLMMYQVLNDDMEIHTGRVVRFQEVGDRVEVTYRDRRSGREEVLLVNRVINCTGPETDCRSLDDPLIADLLAQGLARPDPLFLGLDVAANGALVDQRDQPSAWLFTVGPPRKGRDWEATAVPEIRVQVAELARHLSAWSQGHNSPSRNGFEDTEAITA